MIVEAVVVGVVLVMVKCSCCRHMVHNNSRLKDNCSHSYSHKDKDKGKDKGRGRGRGKDRDRANIRLWFKADAVSFLLLLLPTLH